MIIDARTHIWSSPEQLGVELADRLRARLGDRTTQLDASPARHERSMTCVDGSLVFGFRSDRLDARIPNELVAEFVSREPRRRIGICGVDPMSPDAIDQIESAADL